jgi:hypothetical protein
MQFSLPFPSSARLFHQLPSINLSTARTSNLPPQSTKASNLIKLAHAIPQLKHLDTSVSALGLAYLGDDMGYRAIRVSDIKIKM